MLVQQEAQILGGAELPLAGDLHQIDAAGLVVPLQLGEQRRNVRCRAAATAPGPDSSSGSAAANSSASTMRRCIGSTATIVLDGRVAHGGELRFDDGGEFGFDGWAMWASSMRMMRFTIRSPQPPARGLSEKSRQTAPSGESRACRLARARARRKTCWRAPCAAARPCPIPAAGSASARPSSGSGRAALDARARFLDEEDRRAHDLQDAVAEHADALLRIGRQKVVERVGMLARVVMTRTGSGSPRANTSRPRRSRAIRRIAESRIA